MKEILLMLRVPLPAFVIEKVRVVLVPKSVKLLVLVLLPTGTLLPLPLTAIVAVGADVVVNPLATPPGLTQLDVVPVSAKLTNVPVFVPVASVRVLIPVLVPDGIP